MAKKTTSKEELVKDILSGKDVEIDLGLRTEVDQENETAEEMDNPLADALEPAEDTKRFEVSKEDMPVSEYLNLFENGEIKIPECQRMFVWDDKQVMKLLDSIKKNVSITELKLGEVNGTLYLADGLQRTNALMKLLNSKKVSDEDKTIIRGYEVTVNTTHEMDWESFNEYFYNCNNGTALATSVKECAKLSPDLHEAIMDLSGNSFFREAATKKLFAKNDHKRIIAMAFLCYTAGVKPGITAGQLSKTLTLAEELALEHKDEAKANLNVIIEGLSLLNDEMVGKALNANYICSWSLLFNEYTNINADEVAEVTMKIFGGKKPIPEYSATTGGGAASPTNVKNRAHLYGTLLHNLRKERELDWNSGVA